MASKADNHEWLIQLNEETLEPDLKICDPHHHLWNERFGRTTTRYQLDEYLDDLNTGHHITSTVFIQCGAEYKTDGPEELRPIGSFTSSKISRKRGTTSQTRPHI